MKKFFAIFSWAAMLAGCASSSSIPLAADTVQISAQAAPICGPAGAARVAAKTAAVETLRHGYDKFIILGSQAQNNVGVVGYTPTTAYTTYGNGFATTQVQGGYPIVAGSHDHGLIVKMFKDGDPAGSNAVSAKATLGPKWSEIAASPTITCFD
ncbi:MAG: hypothetical protein WBX25_35830 [Rhodomicrobium sp.]